MLREHGVTQATRISDVFFFGLNRRERVCICRELAQVTNSSSYQESPTSPGHVLCDILVCGARGGHQYISG